MSIGARSDEPARPLYRRIEPGYRRDQHRAIRSGTSASATGAPIDWKSFGDLPGFTYKILHVDEARHEIDMLFHFHPHGMCFHHRHLTEVTSIVLQGEHVVREYDAEGNPRVSVRPTGKYTVSAAGGDAHIEGGGENGAVVLFNFRGQDDHIYDIMDDDLNVVRQVSIGDFKRAFDEW